MTEKTENGDAEKPSLILDHLNICVDWCTGEKEDQLKAKSKAGQKINELHTYTREQVPGFFTPLKSKKEFGLIAATPFLAPIAFPLVAGGALLATGLGSFMGTLGLLATGGLAMNSLCRSEQQTNAQLALDLSIVIGTLSAGCALVAIAAVVLTAVFSPLALAYLTTRSAATLYQYCSPEPDQGGSEAAPHNP